MQAVCVGHKQGPFMSSPGCWPPKKPAEQCTLRHQNKKVVSSFSVGLYTFVAGSSMEGRFRLRMPRLHDSVMLPITAVMAAEDPVTLQLQG